MLTHDQKAKIYDFLAEAYLDLMAKGLIGRFERKVLASKIIKHMETVENYDDVSFFVDSLIRIYPSFQPALIKIKNQVNSLHEQQVISRLQNMIHS